MNVRACQSEYYQFILMKSSSCVISRKPTKVSLRDSFIYELERRSSSSTMPANELVTSISQVKVKVKVRTLDIAPLRGTPPQKRSGTDHTVLPANFTVPASTS